MSFVLAVLGALAPETSSQPLDPTARDVQTLIRARRLIHTRDYARARALLVSLESTPGLEPEIEDQADASLEFIDRLFTVRTRSVGLVAPLSGPYSAIGEAMVRAMKLTLDTGDGPKVVVADTKGTPEGAAAAVERLVLEDNVVAILGPIGDKESRAAAFRASELEVPILTMASARDLPALSPWVFRHRVTPTQQAEAIASHALFELGARTFAIIYPDDDYGRAMRDAFWDVVQAAGAEVRGAVAYGPTDRVEDAVRKLVGGYHEGARRDSFEIRRGDKEVRYRPVVDFEALFVADGPRKAREILSTVAYFDVPIATRPEDLQRLPRKVQILGPATWNGPAMTRGLEPAVQNARFPGTMLPDSPREEVRAFTARFRARYGRSPGSLEAQAHDAAGWMWLAWSRGRREGRPGVQRALLGTSGFVGLTGEVTVEPDGGTITSLPILTVRGSAIVPVGYVRAR